MEYPMDVNAMKLLADIGVKFRAYKDAGYLLTRALDLSPEYCLLYTSPSPRDRNVSRMPSSA